MVGLDDLRDHFQLLWFCDSIMSTRCFSEEHLTSSLLTVSLFIGV